MIIFIIDILEVDMELEAGFKLWPVKSSDTSCLYPSFGLRLPVQSPGGRSFCNSTDGRSLGCDWNLNAIKKNAYFS